ncbi:MAG: ABC transporter ATP-binding protein [Epulopiscium sp.]|nr:ABC transporter ATP-binding protein [Candidatus Epulonipiscium sp.]
MGNVKVMWRSTKNLTRQAFKNNKMLIPLEILLGMMGEAKSILEMLLPAIVLSLIIDPTGTDKALLFVGVVCLAIVALEIGLEIAQRLLQNHSLRVLNYIIFGLNKKGMRIDLKDAERKKVYEQMDKANDGLWYSSDVHYMVFAVIVPKLLTLALTLYIFSRTHWIVALGVFLATLADILLSIRFSKKQYEFDGLKSVYNHQKDYVEETMFDQRAARDMVMNDAKDFFSKKRSDLVDQIIDVTRRKEKLEFTQEIISNTIDFIRTIGIYVIAILRYIAGKLAISDFLLFTRAAMEMTYALAQISHAVEYLFEASHYYTDYEQFMMIPETDRSMGNERLVNKPTVLEFQNVSFRYPNREDYALKNVSFKISTGETIAIVGDNGAGKSTLVNLMMRLYKTKQGNILIDGKSIYDYKYDDYVRYFAPVFQDYNLYYFTVGENVAFDNEIGKSRINDLIVRVGLEKKIASLTRGLDTPYSKTFEEDGAVFSGGEEQRLVIARALAKPSSGALVMDEPTAALDPLAEHDINTLTLDAASGLFKIFISHRLSTTKFADRIFVLDNGHLIESGNHEELINNEGLYSRMFNMQSSYYKK